MVEDTAPPVTPVLQDVAARPSPASRRYSRGAVVLHWTIAAMIIVNLGLGFVAAATEGDLHRQALDWHKPVGIVILGLSLVRLGWRLTHRPPPAESGLAPWEAVLAKLTHWGFYLVMIGQPLTGWWLSSAVPKRHAFGWIGVIEVPFLPMTQSMASAGMAHQLHVWMGLSTIGLLALHLAGVLKHQLIDRHEVLSSMTLSRT